MKKISLLLSMGVVILSVSITAFAYIQTCGQTQSSIEGNESPVITASSSPMITPTPTSTCIQEPTPTTGQKTETEGSFGPRGYFRIISPTNTSYNSEEIILTITGEVINQQLILAYSIDGQTPISFSAKVQQEHDWDQFIGAIHESIVLPTLTSGSHTLTVEGTLADTFTASAVVNFTIQ